MLQTHVTDLLLLKAASAAAMSPWRQCMYLSRGRRVYLSSSKTSFLPCQAAADALLAGVLLPEYRDQFTYYSHHLHRQRQQATVTCSSSRAHQ